MKMGRIIALTAVITALAACGSENDADTDFDVENMTDEQALAGFQFQNQSIAQVPGVAIPEERLRSAAFSADVIARTWVGVQEQFGQPERLGDLEVRKSGNWAMSVDPKKGFMLLQRKEDRFQGPVILATATVTPMQRLMSWGVGRAEIGRVLQRDLMGQSQDGQGLGQPELISRKSFLMREINGIPVLGHRAVITNYPDGSFHRAYVSWPALKSTGHKMRTRLNMRAINVKAAKALRAQKEPSGNARLNWVYVPVIQGNGEVSLELQVAARVAGNTRRGVTEEPRLITVPVSAF